MSLHPAVIAAIIGAVGSVFVATIAAICAYRFKLRGDEVDRARRAAVQFLQRQIEECYSPLLGLIQQRRTVDEAAHKLLPKTPQGTLAYGDFTPENHRAWHFFLSRYLVPINQEIAKIIREKVYLLEEPVAPGVFAEFLEYAAYMECVIQLWNEERIPVREANGPPYPARLQDDAQAALQRLRIRHAVTLEQITRVRHSRRDLQWEGVA